MSPSSAKELLIMNSPKLRFKNFNDEWISKKLGDICNIVMGQSPNSENYNNGHNGIPLIQGNADILDRKTNPQNFTIQITKTCNIGDILMSVRAPVGNVAISYHYACIGRGICSISTKLSQKYVYQFLISYEKNWRKISQGSTFQSINSKDICNIIINLPSIEEQTKIANFLSLIDRKIELQEKLVENLKLYKKGLLQKVFSNNLGWKSAKLGDLGNTYTGLSGKSKEDFKNGNSKFITYMNVFSNCISNNQQLENISINSNETQNKVKYGDIFFTTSSETPKEVGMSSVWLFNDDNIYLNSFCFGFRLNNITNFNIKFLAYLLRSYLIRKKIIFLAQGSTRYNISKNELMNLEILYPNIEEQTKIANLFSNLDKKIDFETNRLTKLKEYKKGLLQQIFI